MTTDPGLGVLETGSVASQGAGFSVAGLGDMNLDGSNDYLIGAPTVTQTGSVISPGTGTTSQAFLVFGNRSVTPHNPELVIVHARAEGRSPRQPRRPAASPTHSRIGLSPTITTLTGSPSSPAPSPVLNSVPSSPPLAPTPSSSVLPTTLAAAVSTTSWPPRASTASAQNPINLDTPTAYPQLTIVTFEDTANPTSGLGSSFADVPNLFGSSGGDDLVIGEPGASLNGKTNNGGVFVFPTSTFVPTTPGLDTVVQVQAQAAFTIAGANSGDRPGSRSPVPVTSTGTMAGAINDLLIGAPHYSVRDSQGRSGLPGLRRHHADHRCDGISLISASCRSRPIPTGSNAGPTPPQGAVFVGAGTDVAGYTVSSAGGFNPAVDSLGDFMIGSPAAMGGPDA